MSVKEFMSENLITIEPDTKIFDAVDLMKKHDIHRLPVLKGGKLVGLITEGTIQAALPSKATSLSVYEVNYLLNKTTVADVMITDVKTIPPTAQLEDAIYLMRKNKIGVLPIVADDQLVGIITNNDIFDAFLQISGYHEGGTRIQVKIAKDKTGVLAELAELLAKNEYSILTVIVDRAHGDTIVEIQIQSQEPEKIRALVAGAGFTVVSAELTKPFE